MSGFKNYKYVDTIPKNIKVLRLFWGVAYILLFRLTPRWTLHGWRRFILRCFGAKIGTGSKIAPSCIIWAPWNLEMGDYSVIADGVDCYSMNKIYIGSKVAISQRSFLCTGTHDVSSLLRPLLTYPIVIKDHVWIAAECFIHPGVVIGEGSVIGARSVVIKDISSWSICAGSPCKVMKSRVIS